jgi:hypothetical protein
MAYDENLEELKKRKLHYVVASRQPERDRWLADFEDTEGFTSVIRQPSPRNPQKKTKIEVKTCTVAGLTYVLQGAYPSAQKMAQELNMSRRTLRSRYAVRYTPPRVDVRVECGGAGAVFEFSDTVPVYPSTYRRVSSAALSGTPKIAKEQARARNSSSIRGG